MGTKIHCESYLPIYPSTRDLNDDSCSGSWPQFCGNRAMTNGQCYGEFMPRAMAYAYPGFDKDALKQKILEHEAVFKNQVFELHRLYRIQRDLMEEARRKEQQCRVGESTEPSSSLSRQGSHVPLQGSRQWHMAGFPLLNSGHSGTSTSGVKIVNSPIRSTEQKGTRPGYFPFPNGSVPKEPYELELRPLKVSRKSFDLELPAEECIETEKGEESPETKVSNRSSYALNGNLKVGLQSNQNLSLESSSSVETDCRTAVSASASGLKNPTQLADLNEPVEIEEAIVPSSVSVLVCSPINEERKGMNQPANPNEGYEYLERSGSSKNILSPTTHGLRQDQLPKPSQPMQSLTSQADHPSGMHSTSYRRGDQKNGYSLEHSDRSYNHSSNGHLVQGVSSQASGSSPLFGSCLNGSWAHSVSLWANTNGHTVPKIPNPSAPMNHALEDSSLSHESSRGNWRPGDIMAANGFSLGSTSVLNELKVHPPSSGICCLNHSKCTTMACNCSNSRRFGKFPVGSCQVDSSSVLDIDLNEDLSKGSLDEVVIKQDSTLIQGKTRTRDCLSSLPWFSSKSSQANVAVDSRSSESAGDASYHRASDNLCSKNEVVRDLNRPCTPENNSSSSDCEIVWEKERIGIHTDKKLLGFPIFEIIDVKKEALSYVSTSLSDEMNPIKGRKNGMIDINLEYDPDVAICEEMPVTDREQTTVNSGREFIDLNSSVSDIEDNSVPSYTIKSSGDKASLVIDLEAPVPEDDCDDDDNTPLNERTEGEVLLQSSEHKREDLPDEVLGKAAEALVAISSSCPQIPEEDLPEASLADALIWFVDALSANGFERPPSKKLRITDFSKMDEFEATALQLPETKETDYLPDPFVPEAPMNEDNTLTMSRRVQSRRGRQRRDFQRDILPGLVSLSRPEMTEDLQVFATLMKATGHHWNSGLTRRAGARNGGSRGRRRAVVEAVPNARACTPLVSGIEACLEDKSLTGWGKTLRRPRRQRCHGAGNPPAPAVC